MRGDGCFALTPAVMRENDAGSPGEPKVKGGTMTMSQPYPIEGCQQGVFGLTFKGTRKGGERLRQKVGLEKMGVAKNSGR